MSNIYIQEPPTSGKIVLVTTVGDIDIELWPKETPKACRNFVQLCLEGYYHGTIFHRLVKDFIIQGGDPTGTGEGGESVYGKPFRDEIHSRLRFVRRGLLAMANAGKDDNGSQFFFTLGPTPELQGKHTIFGKVAGNTIYNMLKLNDLEVGDDERPTQPVKIIRTEVLANPFEDIVPRSLPSSAVEQESSAVGEGKRSRSSRATKDFKLLSFGEEAAEDEEEAAKATKVIKVKGKSAHDVLVNDPHLSSVPAVDLEAKPRRPDNDGSEDSDDSDAANSDSESGSRKRDLLAAVKQKLKAGSADAATRDAGTARRDGATTAESTRSKRDEVRREVRQLQQELFASKRKAPEQSEAQTEPEEETPAELENELVVAYKNEKRKYSELKTRQPRKGADREALTLSLLDKFRTKLETVKNLSEYSTGDADEEATPSEVPGAPGEADADDDADDASWLGHKLRFDANAHKVLDANVHDVERYELFDPRNPLNQRRRETAKRSQRRDQPI